MRFRLANSILVTVMLLSLAVEPGLFVWSQTPPYDLKIIWVKVSNPTSRSEYTYGVCLRDQYLYVVGFENQTDTAINYAWRIEQRSLVDGSLINNMSISFTYNGDNRLFDCVANDTHVIAVGRYYRPTTPAPYDYVVGLAVVDRSTFTATIYYVNPDTYDDTAYSVDTNSTPLYLAGSSRYSGPPYDLDTLTMSLNPQTGYVISRKVRISTGNDELFSVAVNPVTGEPWFAGYYTGGDGAPRWGIRVYSRDFGQVKASDLTDALGHAYSIAFDAQGNAFVAGSTGVRKYSSDGTYLRNVTYVSGIKPCITRAASL